MYRLSSSLRTRALGETLACARRLSVEYGVVRVTDITRLDVIGIPVFASIRPGAEPNSLCVHAGKGVSADEARVGAYMEAIEFAAAEARRTKLSILHRSPRSVVDQPGFAANFVDLCPIIGLEVDPDSNIVCTDGEDVATGRPLAVPAELVFFPYNENPAQRIFGTSTNGLCSGNMPDEATIHGICEVIERDIQAHNFVHDRSVRVELPEDSLVGQLARQVRSAELDFVLRFTPNDHGLAYFQAFILEPFDETPIAISHGTGCHPLRDIAAVRALTEAAQSRLSYIHGGRDDLIERARFFASQEPSAELRETARMRARVQRRQGAIEYSAIPDHSEILDRNVPSALTWLVGQLAERGFQQVLRTIIKQEEGLAVVRVIIPGMESFEPALKRAGPRLRNAVRECR